MPNSRRLFSTWSILSWRVFQSLPPCLTEFWLWLRQDRGGWGGGRAGGSLGSCSRLGGFRREKGGREECVVYSHWLRTILLQSWMVSKTRCLPEKSSSRVTWCLLWTRPAFVLVHEDHLCHETDFSMRHLLPCWELVLFWGIVHSRVSARVGGCAVHILSSFHGINRQNIEKSWYVTPVTDEQTEESGK